VPGHVPGIRVLLGLTAKPDADGQDKPSQGGN